MLGNYKKIASGSINSDTIWKGTGGKQFNINFAFTPKRIIVLIIRHITGSGGGEHLNHAADSDVNYSEATAYFYTGGVRGCYIKNITKNGFFLGTGTDLRGDSGLTIRWIAIG